MSGSVGDLLSAKNLEILASHKVEDILRKSIDVHSVLETDHPEVALKKLNKFQILSLPVYTSDSTHKFKNFINILDLVTFIMRIVQIHRKESTFSSQSWQEILNTESMWRNATCGMIIKDFKLQQEKCLYLSSDSSVSSLVRAVFTLRSFHRIAVFNNVNDTKLLGIITQGTLVRYLYNILDHSDPFFLQSIDVLHLDHSTTHFVNQNVTISKAFELCRAHHMNGVGVVDDEGKLIGNVSASDMRNVQNYTVDDIVKFCSKPCAWLKVYAAKECYPIPISVSPDVNINDVLNLFVGTRIHRVYVIDQDKKPLSVIQLGDIISLISDNFKALACKKKRE
ncbi:uncharacterized protein LOC126317091 [Schistocerca gregaria]|uniref:uncharacterized protein LOC126317091 n=1 Tax=Schistocerca gregaria TaxID=7010 RepID=UPI00211E08AD|nr:uncharacterized protein LOC126317091 [Schistocerca gregaria]